MLDGGEETALERKISNYKKKLEDYGNILKSFLDIVRLNAEEGKSATIWTIYTKAGSKCVILQFEGFHIIRCITIKPLDEIRYWTWDKENKTFEKKGIISTNKDFILVSTELSEVVNKPKVLQIWKL